MNTQKAFNERVGVQRALTRWKKETAPNRKNLFAIARELNVSLKWLLTGQESPKAVVLAEHAPDSYEARPPEPLDEAFMMQTVREVDNYVQAHKIKFLVDQKARTYILVYEHCLKHKVPPDSLIINRYLVLAGVIF